MTTPIIVCGGRNVHLTSGELRLVRELIIAIAGRHADAEIWTGGASGVDEDVARMLKANGVTVRTFPIPEQESLPMVPVRGLPIVRTDRMLGEIEGGHGYCIVCRGGDGTKYTFRRVLAKGLRVIDLRPLSWPP